MNLLTFESILKIFNWLIPLFRTQGILYSNNLGTKYLKNRFGSDPDIWHISTDQGVNEQINF